VNNKFVPTARSSQLAETRVAAFRKTEHFLLTSLQSTPGIEVVFSAGTIRGQLFFSDAFHVADELIYAGISEIRVKEERNIQYTIKKRKCR
jgi:hypothetical protein